MRILHIGLNSHYTEGLMYQDNVIPDLNSKDGHDVVYVTDIYCFKNGVLIKKGEEEKVLKSGVRLIRLNYDYIFNKFISSKIMKTHKLSKIIIDFCPDVILYHGLGGYELMTVASYKCNHPNIKFYVDNHADFNNSARTFLAKFWYKTINKFFVWDSRKWFDKVFYITSEGRFFLKTIYSLPDDILEWFPLGGFIIDAKTRAKTRNSFLRAHNLPANSIIISHSGKLNSLKKTDELLQAFKQVKSSNFVLFICGSIDSEYKAVLEPKIKADNRIRFLGWKNNDELCELLSATDLYCQPGSQSVTAQNAICCGCPVMLYPHLAYKDFIQDNVFWVTNVDDIKNVFLQIELNPRVLLKMKEASYELATQVLDYNKIAARLYE